jgi:anti-sigma factor RsiW
MNERPYITCRQLIEFIIDYLEGELDDVARHDFERHLSVCSSCQAYLATYRRTMELTREATDEVAEGVPEELIRTILARRSR